MANQWSKIMMTVLASCALRAAATTSEVWVPDNGDGTYKNPIIYADYSDPDVIRVGDVYYMTSSSFNCVPGLPILRSMDLVHWELIGHALPVMEPTEVYDKAQHGNGVFAPCMRYHEGHFYIIWGDPDFGIYYVKSEKAEGPWSKPHMIKKGRGFIDPSPLWDDDGKVYISHAFANSRAGKHSILVVQEAAPDLSGMIGEEVVVFNGHETGDKYVEGTKFHKHEGMYYILAPAGGVTHGWQLALRSENVYGPYERKVVLERGRTRINGPHQGAWVETPKGEHWFFHFQDRAPYGRIVHLQPMRWEDGWPFIGVDSRGKGVGNPVSTYKKPDVDGPTRVVTPADSDNFESGKPGLQWQWHGNPKPEFASAGVPGGYYRLHMQPRPADGANIWRGRVPSLLLQKFPSNRFAATAKITFHPQNDGDEAGYIVMGRNYMYISLKQQEGKPHLRVVRCQNADRGAKEVEERVERMDTNTIYFRIQVVDGGRSSFFYSVDGETFTHVGDFGTTAGRWIGAKIGFFALADTPADNVGHVDLQWIRFHPIISN
jgi:beta-xylosidase